MQPLGLVLWNEGGAARIVGSVLLGLTLSCGPTPTALFSPVDGEEASMPGGVSGVSGGSSAGSATDSAGSGAAAGSSSGVAAAGAGGTTANGGALAVGGDGGSQPASNDAGSGGASDAPVLELDLIDDLEGQFPDILEASGRSGYWFSSHDASGGACSQVKACVVEPPPENGSHAACLEGGGLTDWGATLALTLRAPFAAYDASQYCGVRFLAKGRGDGWSLMVSDRVSEPDGGVCSDGGDPTEACFDHLGARFQPGDDWQEFQFLFNELTVVKGYTEQVRALESDALYALLFVFQNDGGADFELLVDDVAFLGPGGCGPAQN